MSRLSGAPRGSPKTIIAPSITRLHGPVRVLRDADIGIGEVLLGFCIGLGRGRGGIPSAFPEPLGVPPLLRLGRCFGLGFGRDLAASEAIDSLAPCIACLRRNHLKADRSQLRALGSYTVLRVPLWHPPASMP